MKKIITLLVVALFACHAFAASFPVNPLLKANEVMVPLNKTGKLISLQQLANISTAEYEKVSGNHLKFADRLGFKLAQRELRKSIAADGTIQGKRLNKGLARIAAGETGFHIGGFALGFFVGLIGVLIAYLINDDYKRNRVKWAWLGFGIFLVIYLALIAAMLA